MVESDHVPSLPKKPHTQRLQYQVKFLILPRIVIGDNITLFREKPSREHPFGFDGRTAIMEQLVVDENIQKYIRGEIATDTKAIENTARAQGMLTLEQKGILAALRGDTTIEEIARVI